MENKRKEPPDDSAEKSVDPDLRHPSQRNVRGRQRRTGKSQPSRPKPANTGQKESTEKGKSTDTGEQPKKKGYQEQPFLEWLKPGEARNTPPPSFHLVPDSPLLFGKCFIILKNGLN